MSEGGQPQAARLPIDVYYTIRPFSGLLPERQGNPRATPGGVTPDFGRLLLESGPLRVVHLSRHKWPGGLVN